MTSAANRAKMVTTETIATFVDADGDGRLDVIEANSGVEATWRVWFNREGPEGLPEWEAQQLSVDHLVEHLQAHGIEVDPALVPIERTRSWETVEVSWCETWDGYPCWGTSPERRSGETNTVAEWIFTDVNSDAFPDIVANTVPVLECEDEVGRYLNESPTSDIEYVHDEFLAMGSCPCNEEPCDEEPSPGNEAAVFLNPLGPLVGWDAPHERPPSWMVSAEASTGVMRWTTGGGWGGPYNAYVAVGPPWQSAGFRDVHGTGRLTRHEGGGAENAYARFEDDRNWECNRSRYDMGLASGFTTSTQTRGLVDLSGDGVPDFVYRAGTEPEPTWWVRFGTTAGFGPPREIVSELEFAISESSGYCGALATTKAGLIDLDGDGKPELVRLDDDSGELLASSITTTDGVVGGVHAGRLVAIENGYGARTEIRYANIKTETNTPHQVSAPEIVVAETQVRVLDGSAADSVITRYAYGTADRRYDPGAERKVFTGYRRMVTLVGGSTDRTGSDLVEGYAILVDRAPPSGFGVGYAAFVLGGRVQEIHRLEGIFGPDPRELLWLEAPYPQVRAHQSFTYQVTELDIGPWTGGDVGRVECHDLREDGAADTYDLLCHHAGVVTPSAVFEWEGLEAPSQGARNVARATAVIEADERGRPLEIVQYGDMRTYADDRCLTIQYASSAGSALSAVAGVWTTDCGWTNATMSSLGGVWVPGTPIMIAGQRFLYDDLPQGSVGRGRLTSRIVENYDTSDGSFLGEHVAVVLAYDALGNVERSVTSRELGTLATRTTTFAYDEFGASLRITTESATDVAQTFTQTAETSTWPFKPAIATDLNGVTTTTTRDHFGRPVHTHLGAAGFSHVVEEVAYAPDGREVTGTTYPAGAGTPRRIHVHLDALGRPRFRQIELGASYGHATLVTDLVEYDGFGRPVYTAAPFEWAVLPFSPDDLPADPGAWPFGVTTAYDSGGLWVRTVEAPGKQPDALKTDVAADIYVSRVEQTWEGGRALTRARGPSENSPGEVSFDAWADTLATALGWPIESARFDANGTRIDLVRRGFDRFGSEAVVERFKQPASATTPVTWTRRYDSLGRLLRLSEPGTAPITHLYDEWGGLLESSWIGSGGVENVSRFAYDGFGRQTLAEIVSVSLQGSETVQSRELAHYDAHSGRSEQPTGDLRGRLSWIEIPKVSAVYFGYDEVGRTSSETHSVNAYGPPVRTSRVFEPGGSLRELRFDTPAGTDRIEYRYDSAMRTESIVDVGNGVPLFRGTQIDAETGYHEILLGNGVREVFDYAPDGRRELERWGVTTNSGQRDQWFMARDAEGRLRQESVNHFGSPYFVQHDYDALDRVVRSLVSGPTQSQDERFEYDPLGNLTRKRNFLQSGQDRDYVYSDASDPDRLCRFGLPGSGQSCNGTYDLAGNLIGDAWGTSTGSGNRLLSYDAASRVREINRGTWRATFQYGPGGGLALTEVTEGSALRRRIWSFGGLIEERTRPDRRTQIERRIPGPLGIVATLRTEDSNSETVYVHGDGRGNRFFTGSDGKIEQELRYRAFGNVLQDSGNPSAMTYSDDLWNGGDDLRELGVVVLGARVFDPVVGRFLQRDPIAFSGSSSKGNPYSFAFNDPVNYADPTGLFSMMIYRSLDDQSQGPVSVNIGFFTVMGVDPTAGLGLVMPNVGEIMATANAAAASALTAGWTDLVRREWGPIRTAGSNLGPRGRGFLRCAGGTIGATGCAAAAPATLGASLACTGLMAHEAAPGCLSMITGRDEDSVFVTVGAMAGADPGTLRQIEAFGTAGVGMWAWWAASRAPVSVSVASSNGTVALAPAAGEVSGLDDLARFRSELGLAQGEGTLARLDVGGRSFYGINAHGQPVNLRVNAITRTHAEADAFQQAANAGVRGGRGTLYVDRALCAACGQNGGVRGMMRQLGLDELEVVTAQGTQVIR